MPIKFVPVHISRPVTVLFQVIRFFSVLTTVGVTYELINAGNPDTRESSIFVFVVTCIALTVISIIYFIVNNNNASSYNEIESILSKNKLIRWNGISPAWTDREYSELPPQNIWPYYTSLESESYYDVPKGHDAAEFRNLLSCEFYKRVFSTKLEDVSAIRMMDQYPFFFAKYYQYIVNDEGGRGYWQGYIFYWISLYANGDKISWRVDAAMLDKAGWNPGEKKKGESDGLRDFLVKNLNEAYRAVLEPTTQAGALTGVREATGERRVLHESDELETPIVPVSRRRVVVDEDD